MDYVGVLIKQSRLQLTNMKKLDISFDFFSLAHEIENDTFDALIEREIPYASGHILDYCCPGRTKKWDSDDFVYELTYDPHGINNDVKHITLLHDMVYHPNLMAFTYCEKVFGQLTANALAYFPK